jgi:hypothetical protein
MYATIQGYAYKASLLPLTQSKLIIKSNETQTWVAKLPASDYGLTTDLTHCLSSCFPQVLVTYNLTATAARLITNIYTAESSSMRADSVLIAKKTVCYRIKQPSLEVQPVK